MVMSGLWFGQGGSVQFVMSYIVQGMSLIELICLVSGGVNGKGLFLPVDCGVGLGEPRES